MYKRQTDDSANDEKILEKEKELFNEYIAGFGLTEDTFLMWQTNTAIQKKVNDYLLKDITVSDSEVDDYITKLTAEAKQAYEKSSSSYATDSEYKKVWTVSYTHLALSGFLCSRGSSPAGTSPRFTGAAIGCSIRTYLHSSYM